MNRQPNLSDGSAGFDGRLDAESTSGGRHCLLFTTFKYSLLWIEMSLLVQAGVYIH